MSGSGCNTKDDTRYLFLFLRVLLCEFLSATRATEGLTDHVHCGSARPRPRTLLDGVVESGLAQLDGRQTEPEAQAEQPGHDRTHLLRTGKGAVNILFLTFDLMTQNKPHSPPESWLYHLYRRTHKMILFTNSPQALSQWSVEFFFFCYISMSSSLFLPGLFLSRP